MFDNFIVFKQFLVTWSCIFNYYIVSTTFILTHEPDENLNFEILKREKKISINYHMRIISYCTDRRLRVDWRSHDQFTCASVEK